jgi:16S rRNA (cytidine1402-2'-O)-methyltransferase
MAGTLYVVATPIGNLEDITLRALRVLREVDLLACEDTRQTIKLLSHYQISRPLTSYHEHNELKKATDLLQQIRSGKQVALLSDSGTPCISDPGYRLVRAALEEGIRVVPIPGANSLVAALSASGRPTDEFTFLGFLPSRKSRRRAFLQELKAEPRTLIFFEAPNRLLESLLDLHEILGERQTTVAREITKLHEEVFFGSLSKAYDHFRTKPVKGEIVLILEKAEAPRVLLDSLKIEEIEQEVNQMMVASGVRRSEAIRQVAGRWNVPRRELYQLLMSMRSTVRGGVL